VTERPDLGPGGLDVVVTVGTGHGPTRLAAFDGALQAAGVAQFNLIRLSSLIPPGSRVNAGSGASPVSGRWGDRLYAVYADARVVVPGRRACAGLGWVQDESGAGVIVEHCGDDEDQVQDRLFATLGDVVARRQGRYRPPEWRTTSIGCDRDPVAAVVVASLRVEPW